MTRLTARLPFPHRQRLMKLPALFAALLLSALPAVARTIDWGNAVADTLVDSAGLSLDDSFTFELGTFGGFTPTASNIADWASHWKVFDRAEAPAGSGWNSTFSFFNSTATLLADGQSSESPPLPPYTFLAGEQAFIWVYNVLDIDPAQTQWALVTNDSSDSNAADDWLMPVPGGKTDLPLEWRLSGASAVVFGGLHDQQGPGDYTSNPGVFDLQTAAVPEPSGAVLLLLGAGFLLRRRRQGGR